MESKTNAPAQHLRQHLPADVASRAGRDSRTEPKGASGMPLRSLLNADALARDSAANIMGLTRCTLRDVERVRAWGAGVGLIEAFVLAKEALPASAAELAAFVAEVTQHAESR